MDKMALTKFADCSDAMWVNQ